MCTCVLWDTIMNKLVSWRPQRSLSFQWRKQTQPGGESPRAKQGSLIHIFGRKKPNACPQNASYGESHPVVIKGMRWGRRQRGRHPCSPEGDRTCLWAREGARDWDSSSLLHRRATSTQDHHRPNAGHHVLSGIPVSQARHIQLHHCTCTLVTGEPSRELLSPSISKKKTTFNLPELAHQILTTSRPQKPEESLWPDQKGPLKVGKQNHLKLEKSVKSQKVSITP